MDFYQISLPFEKAIAGPLRTIDKNNTLRTKINEITHTIEQL